jgi:hypothetical protein
MYNFVVLLGGINTGKSNSSAEYGVRGIFGTFEEHVLKWKKDHSVSNK